MIYNEKVVKYIVPKWKGETLNCHPNYMMKYFDRDGKMVKEFGA